MDILDFLQIALVIITGVIIANYLYFRYGKKLDEGFDNVEAFANPDGPDGDTVILGNESLYDAFYAKVYDKVVDGATRQEAETALTLAWARGFRPETSSISVLDVGCGTGGDVEQFRRAGVGSVIGLDASEAMIAAARRRVPRGDFKVGDVEQIGLFAAGQFNLITLYYFTYYYIKDPDSALRNMFNWLAPGGCLVIHLVNREKFDPVLEAANPFVAFSVQKYSKKRVTKSSVAFDGFDYDANFEHEGDNAEFREEFKFRDGRTRRQVHHLRMPRMEAVVSRAESNGFVYKQFIDLTAIGYEYQYLFCFVR
jgi:SAM-dependent methyltransferase